MTSYNLAVYPMFGDDGDQRYLECGEVFQSRVAFYCQEIAITAERCKRARHSVDVSYEVVGEIVATAYEERVVDFGIHAHSDFVGQLPLDAAVGSYIIGTVDLAVSPEI